MVRLMILIPAFNEVREVGNVIDALPRRIRGIDAIEVVVVDDGSSDGTCRRAQEKGVKVLRHMLNRGLGAALGTGFQYAVIMRYDLVVTVDADGQHDPKDIRKLIDPLVSKKADVAIGSRLLGVSAMPISRKIINSFSNVLTWILFGVWTTDSQSGLRGFTKNALERMHIRSEKMEVSSEIFREIGRLRLRKVELPIHSIYTDYSLAKGQRLANAPNVFWKLFLQRFS